MDYKVEDRVQYSNGQFVDRYRDKNGNPAVAEITRLVPEHNFVQAKVLTGPEKGTICLFMLKEIEPSMKIVSVKRSTEEIGLKVYGKILGESGNVYPFGYIRRPTFRGWLCGCKNFIFDRFAKGQNCKHLKFIRVKLGRYAEKAN